MSRRLHQARIMAVLLLVFLFGYLVAESSDGLASVLRAIAGR
jgi:hypothetical protein